jgi:4-azaleucine resistance transporter AzlC
MRSRWRSLEQRLGAALLRDIALVWLAVGLVGASYGAITVSDGFPVWTPTLMSVLVFAGASQFLFTGIVAGGGSPVAAVLAGLLVNVRHLPFGFALAETVQPHRLLGSYLMVDESVAFALAQDDPERRRLAYFTCAIGLFTCWNIGALVGAVAGTAITDTEAFGLDAAFPAVLLALVLPSLRDPRKGVPALLGASIALALTPVLPPGLPVLCALGGLVLLARRPRPAG